jgi:methylmalonyl-CoA mutase C-terminal domain/subunit
VARALRDGGMEVIYTGRHVSMASIAQTALDEDVDVVGLSILSGAHIPLTKALFEALEAVGIEDEVAVVVGGTVRSQAVRDELLRLGVADVFPGSTSLPDVVERVRRLADERRSVKVGGA